MTIRRTLFAILLAIAASPTWAADNPCKVLAKETGMTERKVRMLLGTPTAYAEYPYTYDRYLRRLRVAVGEYRFDQMMNHDRLVSATADDKARMFLAAINEDRNGNTP